MNKSGISIKGNDDGSINITVTDLGIATKNSRRSHTVFCPALKVLGYSTKNRRDALRDFEKNLTIFFTVHIGEDTLKDALIIGFGWTKDDATELFGSTNESPALEAKTFNLSLNQAA